MSHSSNPGGEDGKVRAIAGTPRSRQGRAFRMARAIAADALAIVALSAVLAWGAGQPAAS
ncbi:MAG: hypothetical protein ACLP4R_02490 [Solirubrobacteraceae bacterium]